MKNLIGGKHIINEQCGALSLVRKKAKDKEHHAYLILETVHGEDAKFYDIHLVQSKQDKTKASIIQREITVDDIMKVGEDCHSFTWNVNETQMQQLQELINSEIKRANEGKINYIKLGESKVSGKMGASLDNAHSTASKEKLQTVSTNASMQALLRDGHNCYSWARGIVEALGLISPKKHWTSFFVADPHRFKGNQVGKQSADLDEPTSPKPGCLMM